jgi:NADPH-dependent 2,4-dienoyl-CoA reductase/sulfur reductase-like enzyme/rhodanese-related sulfurtransferase
MVAQNVVVIGGVAAGPKAAARLRRLDPEAHITIIERGEFLSYAGCGMPFYISGEVQETRDLMTTAAGVVRDAVFFKAVKDIDVRSRTLAEAIDRKSKTVTIVGIDSGAQSVLPYDKLVLATGSDPVMPSLPGLDLNNVFKLSNPNDANAIKAAVMRTGVKRVTIIGAGLIGLEMAAALVPIGLQVTLVEALGEVLPSILDAEIGALVHNHLAAQGVVVRTNEKVLALEGNAEGNLTRVIVDGGEIESDVVIVAVGVRPSVKLAKDAGLEIGVTGAIAVNEYLQTSDPDIYAGGDCVENTHIVSGKKVYTPMGSIANRHGRIIGSNLAGKTETFHGVAGTVALDVLGVNVGRTGLSEREAKALGRNVITALVPSSDCAHYYPDSKMITAKLIVDADSSKILGAQVLGAGEAIKRVDVIATALTFGATIDRLATVDLAYAPPYSTAIDIIQHAANVLRNKRDHIANGIPPQEVKQKLNRGDDFVFLDVRTPKEYEARRIEDSRIKLIPLGKLRERLGELQKDKEIVAFCQISLRGYEAETILEGAGFKDVKFLDGGIVAWPYEKAEGPAKS